MGLSMDERLADYLSKPLPPSRHTQTKPDPEKWRQNEKEIERVMPQLAAASERMQLSLRHLPVAHDVERRR
jgi:hypothetical protein